MRQQGVSRPWPKVTVELTTFELQVIDDALSFAAGEVDKYDVQSIAWLREDIKRTLAYVDSDDRKSTVGHSILRRLKKAEA